ncbi:TPA: O-antigen ligase family protein [Vibrio parahaemolyticus]|nr:O-antigen ligase family protein [Vibrio parahaemolyticus]
MIESQAPKNSSLYYFYFPLLFLLFPTFPRFTGHGDYIVFLFGVGFIVFNFLLVRQKIMVPAIPSIYFLLMLLCLSWSLSLDGYNGIISFSDISEMAKILCYFIFFLYFYNSKSSPDDILTCLVRLIFVFSVFAVVFNLLDVFNLFNFREISYSLYKRESVPILANKAISPFFTTYNFAAFMLLPMSFFFLYMFKANRFFIRIFAFVMFFSILLTILLSQSRSSLITVFLAILFMLFFVITIRKITVVIGVISLLLFLGWYYFEDLNELMPYMFNGVEQIIQGKSNSVNYRQEQIEFVFEQLNSPFGFGVSKSLYMFESLYSLYPSRYGVLFLVLFISLCVVTSLVFYSTSRRDNLTSAQRCFVLSLCVWYLTYPVSGLSSAHHDTTKFSLFFYGFLGLALFLNKSQRYARS